MTGGAAVRVDALVREGNMDLGMVLQLAVLAAAGVVVVLVIFTEGR